MGKLFSSLKHFVKHVRLGHSSIKKRKYYEGDFE